MEKLLHDKPIKISRNRERLSYQDGIPFFWLADTWWYGMTSRCKWEDFKVLVADRKKKGFTVIQTVVGVPPEVNIFSTHAANSGGLPFKKNGRLNLKYFEEVDRKIKYLVDNGLVPCIFGGWGHHIDILGVPAIKRLWKEIVKRYAHLPVVFCLCGEADVSPPPFTDQGSLIKKFLSVFPSRFTSLLIQMNRLVSKNRKRKRDELKHRLRKWDRVARYIKKIDSYHNLLTVHVHSRTTASELFGDPNWLDIDSIQSGHSKDSLEFMKTAIERAATKGKPIINLESWYEGILGNFGPEDQLLAFKTCMKAGAAGHSYGAHGIWQMATSKDNFMGHWGKSDWKKAINLKGSLLLGKAKEKLVKSGLRNTL